jgi:hypothetical protein
MKFVADCGKKLTLSGSIFLTRAEIKFFNSSQFANDPCPRQELVFSITWRNPCIGKFSNSKRGHLG